MVDTLELTEIIKKSMYISISEWSVIYSGLILQLWVILTSVSDNDGISICIFQKLWVMCPTYVNKITRIH